MLMDFGHADDASVSQRHRDIPIFLNQFPQRSHMFMKLEGYTDRAVLEELEQDVLRSRVACKQIHCLCENRFTDKQRRLNLLNTRSDPAMVPLRAVKKGDKRPSISDCGHLGRSLRDAGDSKRDLELPNRLPHVRVSSAPPNSHAGGFYAGLPAPIEAPPPPNP
jgi:hypothetical protein